MKKLTKISVADCPLVESSETIEEYGSSVWNSIFTQNGNHKSPPVDYWVAGNILGDVIVGESLKIYAFLRNGVEMEGIFYTSHIKEIIKDSDDNIVGITTNNSIYIIEDY